MRNFFKFIKSKITGIKSKIISFITMIVTFFSIAKVTLADNRGEGFIDTAIKILIGVVIGALVLGGLYLLFSGTVLPTLTQRVTEMFNYNG